MTVKAEEKQLAKCVISFSKKLGYLKIQFIN